MKKRLISLLLAFSMMLTFLPAGQCRHLRRKVWVRMTAEKSRAPLQRH